MFKETIQKMNPQIKTESDGSTTLSVNFKLSGSFLSQEEQIARAVNLLGNLSTQECLRSFDSLQGVPKGHSLKGESKKNIKRPMVR